VSNPEAFPYRVVGKIYMTYSDGVYTGTGTLIGGNIVLTCGHNLYNRTTKEKPSEVTFTPAFSSHNGVVKGNKCKASFFTVCPEYMTTVNDKKA
jgi:V8-like Glu-specific endopeptidase